MPIFIPRNPVPVKKIFWIFGVLAVIVLTIFVIYIRYGLKARVCLKDQFGVVEQEDGKINDVLIVYSPSDEEIALGTLLAVLENRYHYKCSSKQLPSDINLCKCYGFFFFN